MELRYFRLNYHTLEKFEASSKLEVLSNLRDLYRSCLKNAGIFPTNSIRIQSFHKIITLAISKCYGKVRVLFFPRDNSLISRGNSHVSRVRGLVVRCLLFNPEVSCSNPWVCANFLQVFRSRRF